MKIPHEIRHRFVSLPEISSEICVSTGELKMIEWRNEMVVGAEILMPSRVGRPFSPTPIHVPLSMLFDAIEKANT